MYIVSINKLYFRLDQNKHTVAYAERAESALKGTRHIRHSVAVTLEQATRLLKYEIQDYLTLRDLNPKDFTFDGLYNTSDGGMFWWPPSLYVAVDSVL